MMASHKDHYQHTISWCYHWRFMDFLGGFGAKKVILALKLIIETRICCGMNVCFSQYILNTSFKSYWRGKELISAMLWLPSWKVGVLQSNDDDWSLGLLLATLLMTAFSSVCRGNKLKMKRPHLNLNLHLPSHQWPRLRLCCVDSNQSWRWREKSWMPLIPLIHLLGQGVSLAVL